MTNIQLKAQINSQITNETTNGAITPLIIGGNLKAIVDYVDLKVSIAQTLEFAEITVSHTNGTATNKVGITTANLVPAAGLGLDANGNILFTGEWRSQNTIAAINSVTCRSNVLDADLFDEFSPSRIAVSIMTAYKTAANSTTNSERHSIAFLKPEYYTGSKAPVGSLSSPALIGDTNTLFQTIEATTTDATQQIGLGGAFSRYYYTFALNIPANAATKVYKFKWSIVYS